MMAHIIQNSPLITSHARGILCVDHTVLSLSNVVVTRDGENNHKLT